MAHPHLSIGDKMNKIMAALAAIFLVLVMAGSPAYAGGNGNNGQGNNGHNSADPDGGGKNDDAAGDDGNNGSGNDPDCSDDNNGKGPRKCEVVKPTEKPTPTLPPVTDKPTPTADPCPDDSRDKNCNPLPNPEPPVIIVDPTPTVPVEPPVVVPTPVAPTKTVKPTTEPTSPVHTDKTPVAVPTAVDAGVQSLPNTGGPLTLFIIIGLALLVGGTYFILASRFDKGKHS